MLYVLLKRRISAYRSPLRNLPGPERANWFKGNFVDVPEPESSRLQEDWVRTYGHVLKYHSGLGVRHFLFLFSLLIRVIILLFAVNETTRCRPCCSLLHSTAWRHFPKTGYLTIQSWCLDW